MSARITEAMVEAAAKAAYAVRAKCYDFVFDWDQAGEARKQHYRDEARAALAAALYIEPGEAEGMVLVPKAALDWLFGEGPGCDGLWFGEFPDDIKPIGAFWWRSYFRRMIAAAPIPEESHHGR